MFEKIINEMILTQTDYVAEEEPLFEVLSLYMEDKDEEIHLSGEWHTILCKLAKENDLTFYNGSKTLGIKFNQLETALSREYDIKKEELRSNKVQWTIRKKDI